MQFQRKSLVLMAAVASLFASVSARADWVQSTDPLVVQAKPEMNSVQAQNPPGFTWARHATGPASYEVEVTPVGGTPTRAVASTPTGAR